MRLYLECYFSLSPSAGTAVVHEQTSEMARLLPLQRGAAGAGHVILSATAQTQTEHNEECGCKAITTAVGNSSTAR